MLKYVDIAWYIYITKFTVSSAVFDKSLNNGDSSQKYYTAQTRASQCHFPLIFPVNCPAVR